MRATFKEIQVFISNLFGSEILLSSLVSSFQKEQGKGKGHLLCKKIILQIVLLHLTRKARLSSWRTTIFSVPCFWGEKRLQITFSRHAPAGFPSACCNPPFTAHPPEQHKPSKNEIFTAHFQHLSHALT